MKECVGDMSLCDNHAWLIYIDRSIGTSNCSTFKLIRLPPYNYIIQIRGTRTAEQRVSKSTEGNAFKLISDSIRLCNTNRLRHKRVDYVGLAIYMYIYMMLAHLMMMIIGDDFISVVEQLNSAPYLHIRFFISTTKSARTNKKKNKSRKKPFFCSSREIYFVDNPMTTMAIWDCKQNGPSVDGW